MNFDQFPQPQRKPHDPSEVDLFGIVIFALIIVAILIGLAMSC